MPRALGKGVKSLAEEGGMARSGRVAGKDKEEATRYGIGAIAARLRTIVEKRSERFVGWGHQRIMLVIFTQWSSMACLKNSILRRFGRVVDLGSVFDNPVIGAPKIFLSSRQRKLRGRS